jgi:cell division transport system permease protein
MVEKSTKRRKPSALPSILSLAAVMFILGLLGITVIGFKGLGEYVIENSSIDIYFNDSVSEAQAIEFQNNMNKKPWVKNTRFVTREQGMKEMGDKYDPDFMNYVETITLPLSVEVYSKAEFAEPKFQEQVVKELKKDPQIEDVVFQKNWLETISKNIQKMQIVYMILALLFIIISIVLIQSAVRLGIFANRHTIKSMQFVGATNSFIIRPIILTFFQYAIIAIPISFGLIWFIIWQLPELMPNGEWSTMMFEFRNHIQIQKLFIVSVSIAIFGVLLATICSWWSTRKFLRTKIENLY